MIRVYQNGSLGSFLLLSSVNSTNFSVKVRDVNGI